MSKKKSFLTNFLNREQTLYIKEVKSKLKSPTSLNTSVLFFQHETFSKGRCNLEAKSKNEALKAKIKFQTFFNKLWKNIKHKQKCHSSTFKAKEDKVGFF